MYLEFLHQPSDAPALVKILLLHFLLSFIHPFIQCVCLDARGNAYAAAYVQRPEASFQELNPSFNSVESRDRTQLVRLESRCFIHWAILVTTCSYSLEWWAIKIFRNNKKVILVQPGKRCWWWLGQQFYFRLKLRYGLLKRSIFRFLKTAFQTKRITEMSSWFLDVSSLLFIQMCTFWL